MSSRGSNRPPVRHHLRHQPQQPNRLVAVMRPGESEKGKRWGLHNRRLWTCLSSDAVMPSRSGQSWEMNFKLSSYRV